MRENFSQKTVRETTHSKVRGNKLSQGVDNGWENILAKTRNLGLAVKQHGWSFVLKSDSIFPLLTPFSPFLAKAKIEAGMKVAESSLKRSDSLMLQPANGWQGGKAQQEANWHFSLYFLSSCPHFETLKHRKGCHQILHRVIFSRRRRTGRGSRCKELGELQILNLLEGGREWSSLKNLGSQKETEVKLRRNRWKGRLVHSNL